VLHAQNLAGNWTLRVDPDAEAKEAIALIGTDIPARVPGCVHADLLRAGELADPFLDDNELKAAWVGRTGWEYSRPIAWTVPRADRVDLVFDGLDTMATVRLGDRELGRTRNMHRTYRFDVTGLESGELRVHFDSAYDEAGRLERELGPRPNAYPEPFNFVRKMACSFGWDWGPTLPTAGIWRSVRLEGWSIARLDTVRPLCTYGEQSGAHIDLALEVERDHPDAELTARVRLDGADLAVVTLPGTATTAQLTIPVPGARPWWPRGYGDQPLYDLEVVLSRGTEVLDTWRRRTGFRTAGLDRSEDGSGRRFVIEVNGRPIWAKGVNWIPEDVFPSEMTRDRYATRLRQAANAGVNLIRVWGGGIYESRDFYELCDELGLLVWQDFLFACACYPEEEPLASEVAAEARDNVLRLSPHPSLILWNGNNENLWLYRAAGWDAEPGGDRSWGENYYLDTLARTVAILDPSRPYSAGSPWSGSWDHEPNSPEHETFHSWDVWNREDYLRYRDSRPRFVAEFGWQAPPAWTTLREAVSDEPLTPESPGVVHHQKAGDGQGKLARGLAYHFPEVDGTEAWHYLTQLNQVRAVRTGIDHWRSYWPHTAGTIVWQLNDCWPVISWSAIDGAGRFKPLYFALREAYANRAVTLQPRGGGLAAVVLNDDDSPWAGRMTVRCLDTSGAVRAATTLSVSAPPRSAVAHLLPAAVAAFDDVTTEFLVAELDDAATFWFPAEDKVFRLPDPGLDIGVEAVDGGLDIRVRASRLARDILVQPDRIHPSATVDRGFVTLLGGQETLFRVRCPVALGPSLADRPWVITDLHSALARPVTADGA
jgi:beta-mannosidase